MTTKYPDWIYETTFVQKETINGKPINLPCFMCGKLVDTYFPDIEEISCNKCAQKWWHDFVKMFMDE